MRKFLLTSILTVFILFTLSCDNKEKAKYVAKSTYNELVLKYENLEVEKKLLARQNQKLKNENELLKHDLKKYQNGFKSMYE